MHLILHTGYALNHQSSSTTFNFHPSFRLIVLNYPTKAVLLFHLSLFFFCHFLLLVPLCCPQQSERPSEQVRGLASSVLEINCHFNLEDMYLYAEIPYVHYAPPHRPEQSRPSFTPTFKKRKFFLITVGEYPILTVFLAGISTRVNGYHREQL